MTETSPIKNLTDIKSRVVDNKRQLDSTFKNYNESLRKKAEKEKEFVKSEEKLSKLDKEIKASIVEYLQKIPDINEKQANEDTRTTKIANNISETNDKIKILTKEIETHKQKKKELEDRCTEMRKYKEFLEKLRKGEDDISDIQQLLEKWNRLTKTRNQLSDENKKLEGELDFKKSKYQNIKEEFLAESLKLNNKINEVDEQLNANAENTSLVQQNNQRENINDKINELYDLFTKLEYVLGRWDEVQKEMKNIVVTTKKDDDPRQATLTFYEMKRHFEAFKDGLALCKEEEYSRARSLFYSWDRVRDLYETLISNKGRLDSENKTKGTKKNATATDNDAPAKNTKLEQLVRKQEADLQEKVSKLLVEVERELTRTSLAVDPNEFVAGESVADKLYNSFVKVKAVFEKVRLAIRQKFASKTAAKKEPNDENPEEDKSNGGEAAERDVTDKLNNKKAKDNSDELLSKKWDDLKMKLEKIKVNFENLNKAYKLVADTSKKHIDM